jgi:hypothetical protein
MQPAAVAPDRRAQIIEVAMTILRAVEARLAVVAALNHMLRNTDKLKAGFARHGHLRVAMINDQAMSAVGILVETVF